MKKLNLALALMAAFGMADGTVTARAGNDIYFVTYNHYIDKGELEF